MAWSNSCRRYTQPTPKIVRLKGHNWPGFKIVSVLIVWSFLLCKKLLMSRLLGIGVSWAEATSLHHPHLPKHQQFVQAQEGSVSHYAPGLTILQHSTAGLISQSTDRTHTPIHMQGTSCFAHLGSEHKLPAPTACLPPPISPRLSPGYQWPKYTGLDLKVSFVFNVAESLKRAHVTNCLFPSSCCVTLLPTPRDVACHSFNGLGFTGKCPGGTS